MNFLLVLIPILLILLDVLSWLIFVWVILSWVLFFLRQSQFRWRNRGLYNLLERLNDIFERLTRPVLRPIRRFLRRFPTRGIDWSPLVLVMIIWILRHLLANLANRLILQ